MTLETSKHPSLKECPDIVKGILSKERSGYSISTQTEAPYEHLKIKGKRIDIFASDIERIREHTGFWLHGVTYWNEPDFCDKYRQIPKYMRAYTKGDHIEVRFVRDLAK